jgi:hypothetical protein
MVLTVTGLLAVATLAQAPASARAPRPWTPPAEIPGTFGLVNPVGATAPNGTDLVVWIESTGGTENQARAKLRLPGDNRWLNVPARPRGLFLGVTDIEPTPSGDFWVVYTTYNGTYTSYIAHLDSRSQRWSKSVKLFKDMPDFGHLTRHVELARDGTLVVSAYSPAVAGGGVARVAVAIRRPGGTWHDRFVSPPGHFANPADLSVNASGDILVSFIQENTLPEMTVRAATRAHGKHAKWKVSTLSVPGDSQRVHSALGADGTAAVVWTSTSTSFDAVRMATRNVRRPLAPWVGRDAVTGSTVDVDAYALVDPHGAATAFWAQVNAGDRTLMSRTLVGTTFHDAVQVSRAGESGVFADFAVLPNGKQAIVYKRIQPGTSPAHILGTDYRTLNGADPGPPVQIIGDQSVDGDSGVQWLGVDAASQATDIYSRGTFPDTDFAWRTHGDPGPKVMTGPASGRVVHRAHVSGRPAVGRAVVCNTGYWVETSVLSYHWKRDGRRIHGATAKRYRISQRDRGHDLSCTVAASNRSGRTVRLASPDRRVR